MIDQDQAQQQQQEPAQESSDSEASEPRRKSIDVRTATRELVRSFRRFSGRHSNYQTFSDFVEMAALSFSNAVDLQQYDEREARYMAIVKRYSREEANLMAEMLGMLTLAMEGGMSDLLGHVFGELELGNAKAGQFFTPYEVSRMMAAISLGDVGQLRERITEQGFVTAMEPAVGAGGMVIALADEMLAAGVNYQKHLHVTAVDIDPRAVHMAYVQFSLLHIPAVVVLGNTLALEERERWYTPAHIMGGWSYRLRRHGAEGGHAIEGVPESATAIPPARAVEPAQSEGPAPSLQLALFG